MKNAVFLDRDGIINELVYEPNSGTIDSPLTNKQVTLMHGISELIKTIKEMGFIIIICSNQPAVGLGKTSLKNFQAVTGKILNLLKKEGATLDYQYYCMHHPFAKIAKYRIKCNCRKPKAGLFLKASFQHNINLKNSWIIGDGVDDILAGQKAGCKTLLLANIKSSENLRIIERQLGHIRPDFIIKKLSEALEIIKKNS